MHVFGPFSSEVEATALARENEAASEERLKEVRQEISRLRETLKPLQLQYAREKETLDELRQLALKEDELKAKIEKAERLGQMDLVAELRYDALPGLQKRLCELRKEQETYEKTHKPLLTEVRRRHHHPLSCSSGTKGSRQRRFVAAMQRE